MGSFLAPIFVIIVVNVFFFIWVVIVLARHTKGIARRTKQAVSNKQILRIMFSITGVLFLFGITWGFFILTFSVTGLRETFQTLFTVFNSLQGFFIFAFIFFTEGFGYWKELMRCNRMHKPKSTQTSAPTTKPSNFPNKVRVHETDSSEISGLHGKNLESNTRNRKLEPTLSSAASSMELTSADTSCSGTKVQDDDNIIIVYSNDYIVDGEQHDMAMEEEGGWRTTTDAMPLKILVKRYSTKQYKQHHVEEMKVEFFDEA